MTLVNLNPRPDGRGINSSPVPALIPLEKFYKGCQYQLRIAGEFVGATVHSKQCQSELLFFLLVVLTNLCTEMSNSGVYLIIYTTHGGVCVGKGCGVV